VSRLKLFFSVIEWEAVLWLVGLIYLCLINPYQVQSFSLCPFHNLGISFCPGCGLGRSISFFYYGDFINSFKTHPLGIAGFFIILLRVIKLSIKMNHNYHKTKEVIYGKYSGVAA
jgi:hypothetical protein